MTDSQKIRFLVGYILRYRVRLVAALLCSLFVSLLSVGSIVMLKPVLDILFGRTEEIPPLQYRVEADDIQLTLGLPGVDPDRITISRDNQRIEITAPRRKSQDWFSECYLPDKSRLDELIHGPEESSSPSASILGRLGSRDRLRDLFEPLYARIAYQIHKNRLLILAAVVGLTLVLTVLKAGVHFTQLYLTNWIGRRVIMDIRRTIFDHLLAMDMGFFGRRHSGDLLSHLTIDAELLGSSLFAVFGQALLEPLTILATLSALFFFYPLLTTIYLLLLPFIVVIVAVLGRRIRKARSTTQVALGSMNALLQETFSSMPIVKAFAMHEERERKFSKENRRVFSSHMRIVKARGTSNTLTESLGAIGVAAVLMVGGFFVFQGRIDATSFLVYIFMLANLYHPIKRLNKAYNSIQQGMAGVDRVFSVLALQPQVRDAPDTRDVPPLQREITFDRVSFSYDGKTPVLRDVSLRIPKGSVVALVGPSGAGKSTLVSLIPRFYDPSDGTILLDGQDLRTAVSLRSLRNQIGLVPQETHLFNDTVLTNIACGNESYSQEQVEAAARDAQAHDFILDLPDGYDSIVGERGCTLSGGQAQRVAIARALLKDPPILILDEATSSLDSESELLIREALDRLMKNRTVFVIAHRLSTVLHADIILVMEGGSIIDSGTHAELLERCPLYQRLYELQFATVGQASSLS